MNKLIKVVKKQIPLIIYCFVATPLIFAGDTHSVQGTKIYFVNIQDGDFVKSPFLVQFGLSSQMGIARYRTSSSSNKFSNS